MDTNEGSGINWVRSDGPFGMATLWAFLMGEHPKTTPRPDQGTHPHADWPQTTPTSRWTSPKRWSSGPTPLAQPQCDCSLVYLRVDGPQSRPLPLLPIATDGCQRAQHEDRACKCLPLCTPRAADFWPLSVRPFPTMCDHSHCFFFLSKFGKCYTSRCYFFLILIYSLVYTKLNFESKGEILFVPHKLSCYKNF